MSNFPPTGRQVTSDPNTLPILHSIIHADHVLKVIQEHWDFPRPHFCELIARGMNDNYLLRAGDTQYAVRLYNARGRTPDEIDYEADYLDFIEDEGKLPMSRVIRTRNGRSHVAVQAPEGTRYISMFNWAKGRELVETLDAKNAYRLGELMGRLHVVSPGYKGGNRRLLGHADSIRKNFQFLEKRVLHRPEDLAFYRKVYEILPDQLDKMDKVVPMGPTHGDMTVFNVFEHEGELILMDFETCGYGHFSHELGSFAWSANKNKFAPEVTTQYLAGYDSIRPRDKVEKDLLPMARLMKDFTQLVGVSRGINAIGYSAYKFKGFDWAIDSCRTHVANARLFDKPLG